MNKTHAPSQFKRALAQVCLNCPVCRNARRRQKGPAFWLTSKVETRVCPFCRAYKEVFGRSAHEPTEESGSKGHAVAR